MPLARVDVVRPVGPAAPVSEALHSRGESAFDHLLDGLIGPRSGGAARPAEAAEGPESGLRFSRHARARLRSRGIELSEEDLAALSEAVDRLSERGARESLVLMGDHAFIIGVPRRTVITAMTRTEATGSVFTQIDSTLVLR